jgi:NADH:ubiquinone oxidoreductase subunit C
MDLNIIKDIFNDCELIGEKIVIKSDLIRILDLIKKTYGFILLKDITAVDNRSNGVELIYRLYSPEDDENVVISITAIDNKMESVSEIFDSAVADEKEIYDLFGINFVGNPELERLYMPESWVGYPLKKDYEEKDERLNWND